MNLKIVVIGFVIGFTLMLLLLKGCVTSAPISTEKASLGEDKITVASYTKNQIKRLLPIQRGELIVCSNCVTFGICIPGGGGWVILEGNKWE
jgi:hypothetical protein